MNQRITFFLTALLLAGLSASGQRFLWDARFGGPADEAATGMVTDATGDSWTAGYFADTVFFSLPSGPDSLQSAGSDEGLLLKHNPGGQLLWAGAFSGPGEVRLWSVTADGNHVVVAGTFTEIMDADPGQDSHLITSEGGKDFFTVKLTLEGELVWVRQWASDEGAKMGQVVLDINENVLLSGSFPDTLDFDPGDGVYELISAGNNDAFVLKLDAGGNFVWAGAFSGPGSISGISLGTDADGNILAGGSFAASIDSDPGVEEGLFTSLGGQDIYIIKLDAFGQLIWARTAGGQNDDVLHKLAVSQEGGIYATGRFSSNLDFDTDNPGFNLQSVGSTEAWLARMDAQGEVLWTKRMGGSGSDNGNAVSFDSQGGCFVGGSFSQTMSIGPVEDEVALEAFGSTDAFVLRFTGDGTLLWKRRAGGSEDDEAVALAPDAEDNVLVTGMFRGTGRFNPGNWNQTRVSAGGQDVFHWKMGQCQPASGAASHISCGEVLNINGQAFTETGNYEQWIFTPQGCDSLVFLDLDFFPLNLTITLEDNTFTAAPGSDAYQWVDCTNGFIDIPGAQAQTFTPGQPGAYAVTVFNGPCSETTECLSILSVNESAIGSIVLFPNPNRGSFNLNINAQPGLVHLRILDVFGRQVMASNETTDNGLITIEHSLPTGIYAVQIRGLEKFVSLYMIVTE